MLTSWRLQRIIEGLTQAEVARAARITVGRLSLIERGLLRPTREESDRLTDVLAYRAARAAHEVRA